MESRLNWEEFSEGWIVVHCNTKEKAKKFLKHAKKHGLRLNEKTSIIEFDEYKEKTCYKCFYNKHSTWRMFLENVPQDRKLRFMSGNHLEIGPVDWYIALGEKVFEWERDQNMKYCNDCNQFITPVYNEETYTDKCSNCGSEDMDPASECGICKAPIKSSEDYCEDCMEIARRYILELQVEMGTEKAKDLIMALIEKED